jgi:DNA-binding CsgD family transcriptional regulator
MTGAALNQPRCRSRRRLNALSVAQIVVELQRCPTTLHELVEYTGLSIMTVRSYVLTLHKLGGCHIEHWEPDRRGAYVTPAWRMGAKRDAPKPTCSDAERAKRFRARLRNLSLVRATAGAAA